MLTPVSHRVRPSLIVFISGILSVSGCTSLHISDIGRSASDDWLTEGGTPKRDNAVYEDLQLPLEQEWEYNAGGGFGPGGPLVSGNYVFVHTRKGEVHAVSVERGKKVGADSFGESVDGSPALRDELLFVPSAWGSSKGVVAHNLRSGTRLWKYTCPPVDEGLLLTEGLVIFSDVESTIHALDIGTGTVVWKVGLDPAFAVTTTPILVSRRIVVFADDRGFVYAFDAEAGRRLWTAEIGGPVYATPSAANDVVVVGTSRGVVMALNAETGATLWQWSADDAQVKMASPAIRGERIVIGSSDGSLRAFGVSDGQLEWTWHGDSVIAAAPLIGKGQIYFGTMGRRVYVLDATTGHELWSTEVRGRVKSAPTVHRGSVFILSEPRYLYRFIPSTDAVAEVPLHEN